MKCINNFRIKENDIGDQLLLSRLFMKEKKKILSERSMFQTDIPLIGQYINGIEMCWVSIIYFR